MSLDPRFLPSFAKLCAQTFDRPRSKIWDARERFICGFSEITDRFQSCEFNCISDSSGQAHHLDQSVVGQVRSQVKHFAAGLFSFDLQPYLDQPAYFGEHKAAPSSRTADVHHIAIALGCIRIDKSRYQQPTINGNDFAILFSTSRSGWTDIVFPAWTAF